MEGVEKFLKEAETYYLATPSLQKMYSADDGNTERNSNIFIIYT